MRQPTLTEMERASGAAVRDPPGGHGDRRKSRLPRSLLLLALLAACGGADPAPDARVERTQPRPAPAADEVRVEARRSPAARRLKEAMAPARSANPSPTRDRTD